MFDTVSGTLINNVSILNSELQEEVTTMLDRLDEIRDAQQRLAFEVAGIRAKLIDAYHQRFAYEVVLHKGGNTNFPKVHMIKLFLKAHDESLKRSKDTVELHMEYFL